MKDKTISKILQEKAVEFIKSLPRDLRDDIIDSCYFTGGSLMNLKQYNSGDGGIDHVVNDYDIYFKHKSSLLKFVRAVLQDYHNDMDNEKHYKKAIKELSLTFRDIYGNEYSESDYYSDDTDKIFLSFRIPRAFSDLSTHDYFRHVLKQKDGISFLTKHSINIGKFQVILRFCGNPDEVHQYFDFEHAKGVYDFKTGNVSYSDKCIRAIQDKELIYNGSKYPLKSILRAIKFTKRGWDINNVHILKMVFQLYGMDLSDKNILEDQLTGVYGDNISAFFDSLTDAGIESDIFTDLIETLKVQIQQKKYPAYADQLSIIDFLNNY